MSLGSLVKFGMDPLGIICKRFKLSKEANDFMVEDSTNESFLSKLMQEKLYPDAINFISHALPTREAIWWGYVCVINLEEKYEDANIEIILSLIKEWIYNPLDKTRREIEVLSEKVGLEVAAGWLGLSVFWSGGSITPVGGPEVMPAEYLYAKAVAGAVMLSAALNKLTTIGETYQHFIIRGIDIANGGNGKI